MHIWMTFDLSGAAQAADREEFTSMNPIHVRGRCNGRKIIGATKFIIVVLALARKQAYRLEVQAPLSSM
jgi:hypothetical protein